MASIDVARVVVMRAAPQASQWRAVSYGANGEKIAWTEAYHNYADAEAAAYTISAGAEIVKQDSAEPETPVREHSAVLVQEDNAGDDAASAPPDDQG